jgi:hypothetical protein
MRIQSINSGTVLSLKLLLAQKVEGFQAIDERRAITTRLMH